MIAMTAFMAEKPKSPKWSWNMQGLFQLQTAADLREKLRRDLERLEENPLSVDAAFNFFVTADHMLDWVHPGNKKARENERNAEILLQVCWDVGNNAKHFKLSNPHHKSVSDTQYKGGMMGANMFGPNYFGRSYFGYEQLLVELKGDAAIQLGPTITVIELARRVMEYWNNRPGI